MRRQLTWSVLADGGTDRMLVPIIQWAIHRLDPAVEILEPQFRKRRRSIGEELEKYSTGSMLVFVHRDAENVTLEERLREFDDITRQDVVPVVPVQMSEAWILFNGTAIALAAGSSSAEVSTPSVAELLEGIRDPKARLDDLLVEAAGRPTGRRGKVFRRSIVERRVSVAGYISDYAPLERVPAFASFQETLAARYPYPAAAGT